MTRELFDEGALDVFAPVWTQEEKEQEAGAEEEGRGPDASVSGIGLTAEDGTPVMLVQQVATVRTNKGARAAAKRFRRRASDFVIWIIGIAAVSAIASLVVNWVNEVGGLGAAVEALKSLIGL